MGTVPTLPSRRGEPFPDGRRIVALRVDLMCIVDPIRQLMEWKVHGWAAQPGELYHLHVLQLAMQTHPTKKDLALIERLAHMLEEYCEPF